MNGTARGQTIEHWMFIFARKSGDWFHRSNSPARNMSADATTPHQLNGGQLLQRCRCICRAGVR
jgi:hypothetical protein